jgi:hypothetical protein
MPDLTILKHSEKRLYLFALIDLGPPWNWIPLKQWTLISKQTAKNPTDYKDHMVNPTSFKT